MYIFKALGCVQGKAFIERMWETEWQAVQAFELGVRGRGQTVRLKKVWLLGSRRVEKELNPQQVHKCQSQSFAKMLSGKNNFSCPISYVPMFPMLCFVVRRKCAVRIWQTTSHRAAVRPICYSWFGQWNSECGRWSYTAEWLWLLPQKVCKFEWTANASSKAQKEPDTYHIFYKYVKGQKFLKRH